jgi:hypothetical protein
MFGRLNEMKDSKIISSEARRKVASLRDYMTVPKKLSDSSSTEDYLAAAVALRTKTAKMLTFQANAQMNIDEDGSVQTKRHHTRKRFDSYAKARINHDYNQSFEVKGGGAKFDWKAYGPGSTDGYMAVDKYLTERFNTDPADSMASGALQGRSSSGTYTTNVDGEMKTIKMSGLDPYAGMGIQPGGFTKIKSAIIKRSDMSGASLEKIAKAEQTRARSRRKVKGKAFIDLYGEWQYASLGKIMTSFVAAPLASSGRFDEVQLYFYCFNDRSSWMWTQNMSSMPISIEKFRGRLKAWRKKRGNVSINSFLAFVNKAFVSSMDNSAYGFGGYYKWDEKNLTVKVKEKVNVAEMHADREKVLLGAYDTNGSGDQNLVFKRPSMAVYVEVVPARTRGNPEGLPSGEFTTICRVHVYDRSACKYTGAQQIATMASNTNLGIIKSGLLPLVKMKDDDLGGVNSMDAANHNMRYNAMIKAAMDLHLLKKESIKFEIPPGSELAKKGVTETKPQDVFTIQGGPEAIKYFIKSNMPNISLNSATSAVIKASAASQHNSKNATIHMIRMNKESKDQKTLPGTDELGLPMRMSPMSVSLDVFGCPLINFGQQFFIDFGTNTTIDDIYGVVGISHTITPGEFKTNVKFVKMESYGKYESLLQTLNKASLKLNQAQLIAPSNDTKDAT